MGGKPGEAPERYNFFAQEYLRCFNGTQAAIAAGYSPKTAQEQASRLLSNVIVKAKIKEMSEKLLEGERDIIRVRVIKKLVEEAFNEDNRASDRIKALELLGKYSGLLDDKMAVSISGDSAAPLAVRLDMAPEVRASVVADLVSKYGEKPC